MYHVINRGNYRRDAFASDGAAEALERTLMEAARQYGWKVHAYVVMRNHYHVALETPGPTLVEGMQWFQSTLANRFNRYRKENGHLFQGRYKAQVLEDETVLARVVDYIHLNPVRAKAVVPEEVGSYRWSSLFRYLRGEENANMSAGDWLAARGVWKDDKRGRRAYAAYLVKIGRDEAAWEREGLVGMALFSSSLFFWE
jgi:REP element-mobilizing transposase RayT